ncbi:MAG: nitroreductase family protein [Planctomycetota bacterium]
MDTLQAIRERRAVKHYDPDYVMPEEDIRTLMETAMQAPTSFNIQNWRFVAVTDPEVKKELRAAAWDQAQVTDASLVLLLTFDLKAYANEPERYFKDAPQEVREMLVPMIGQFYEGKEDLQRDEGMRSCGIAGATIMLAAKAMGLDSCPMIGFDQEKVTEIIRLPENHGIGFMIAVGKATKPAWPKPGQLPYEEVVINNRFDN